MIRKSLLKLIQECLLRLMIKNCLKNILKYGKKINNSFGKEFYDKLHYKNDENNKRYINSKIKIINDEIKTNFHDKETPKPKIAYDCFSVISLDSIIKANDMYYPQVYLQECQYRIKKNKKKN